MRNYHRRGREARAAVDRHRHHLPFNRAYQIAPARHVRRRDRDQHRGRTPLRPDAQKLADEDKYQFQWWALGLVGARPLEEKKGADKGIDGKILFRESPKDPKPQQVIFSVKGGGTSVRDVRDLRGVIERDQAAIGVLLTMQEPTKPMKQEAAEAGFFSSAIWHKQYPRLQIYTVAELLAGRQVERPPTLALDETYKRAPKAQPKAHEQPGLGL